MANFKEIIEEYKIKIPIIQRDYAQGREDSKASKIRASFLNSIYDALENSNELHLDFIYGSIKQDKFIPLDGQQRLTTLFLLYWYFGKKEEKDISYLTKFTYETRASSREFSNKLVSSDVDFLDTEISISRQIKDSSWFLAYWENDPTIRAMLKMIDDIHSKFSSHSFYDNLDKITFNFFELKNFGLDDDLYIKMNARGKSLTAFENFKAKFEKFLSQFDNELNIEFSRKIDNEWTDFFWKYGVGDGSYLIDKFFMNYFNYVTKMLHYKNNYKILNENEEIDFKQIKTIYSSKENIRFLFKSLDKLQFISEKLHEIFSTNEYEENKVCLFDNDINILEKIIKDKEVNIQQQILLFIIINHLIINTELNDSLMDLLRISRNLIYRIKHLKTGAISYTIDPTLKHIHSLLRLFLGLVNKDIYHELTSKQFRLVNSGITKESLQFEIDKAKIINKDENIKLEVFRLEDHKYIKGDIHNFLVSDITELKLCNNAIRKIYSQDDSLIIRSMLTIKDYSLWRGQTSLGWTSSSYKYFFGKEHNWEIILTKGDKFKFFNDYFNAYKKNNNDLNEIINSFLTENDTSDWKYYFIKYSEMTAKMTLQWSRMNNDDNIYAWDKNEPFAIEKMGGSNLNAYHLNPYINTVAKRIKKRPRSVKSNDYSFLKFAGLKIYSDSAGWKIRNLDVERDKEIISKYNIVESSEFHILKETEDKDRIEILISFLDEIGENRV